MNCKNTWLRRLAWGTGVFLLMSLGMTQLWPPAGPANPAADQFSCDRALAHVRAIASVSHPTGSAANDAAREYLLAQLRIMGLHPHVQTATVRRPVTQTLHTLHNVLARLPGKEPGPAVMLACHYDSVPKGPGASDDGAAVGALLEAVRALKSGPQLQNDVILLITEGEELWLLGARAFVREHPWAKDVGLVLNFDARGTSGPSILFETSTGNAALIHEFAAADPYPVGTSLGYDVYRRLPNDTDFTIFRRAGMQGLNFAFIDNYVYYHTPGDSVEHLDRNTLTQTGMAALALARHFANADLGKLADEPQRDVVFFNPFRGVLLVYGSRWIWPLTWAVLAMSVISLSFGLYRRRLNPRGIAEAVARLLISLVAAAGAVYGAWAMAKIVLNHGWISATSTVLLPVSPASPTAIRWLVILFTIIALFVTYVAATWRRRWASSSDLAAAGVVAWGALAVCASRWLPGGSYLAAWPAIFALIGFTVALFPSGPDPSWKRLAISLVASVPALLLLPPSISLFFTALTVQKAYIVTPLISLGLWLLFTSGVISVSPAKSARPTSASR